MICKKCNGKGHLPEYMYEMNDGRCWTCGGTGQVENNPTKIKGHKKEKIDPEKIRLERQMNNYKKMLEDYKERPQLIEYEKIQNEYNKIKKQLEV